MNAVAVWAAWGQYSACSVTCGSGTRRRSRSCVPANGGCRGRSQEIGRCDEPICEVGELSNNTCNSLCDNKTRLIVNISPKT